MVEKRKKPLFYRAGWTRRSKLGRKRKKKRKWRASKGGDSKIRLKERGFSIRPTIGWGSDKRIRGKIKGYDYVRVENLKQLENLEKGKAILIASVGKKKREEIIKKANERGLIILNKYKQKENES